MWLQIELALDTYSSTSSFLFASQGAEVDSQIIAATHR